jgi:hypothetical protein
MRIAFYLRLHSKKAAAQRVEVEICEKRPASPPDSIFDS